MSIRLFCSFALALIVSTAPVAADAPRDYTDYSVVEVQIDSQYALDQVSGMVESVWTDYPGLGRLPVMVSPEQKKALEAAGYACAERIGDVQPLIDRQRNVVDGRGDWDDYMTFSKIVSFINDLATQRPDLCEVFSIGQSIQGRDLWVLHITGPGGENKPAVMYQSLIHAREWITAPQVLYLADHLVSNYETDSHVKELVDGLDIYLLPCVNPDGYVYTWDSDRMWRKNRRYNGAGSYGVDLNRNWDAGWGGPGASGYPDDETYYGTAPFSEPETTAISDFILAHPNIVAHMDYHSYSQLLLWPFGYQCLGGPPEPDRTEFDVLGGAMADMIYDVHHVYYEAGPICETIYQASGGSTDWAYESAGAFAFTIELRDTGYYGFLLPPEQILPTCEENFPAIMHLTEWAYDRIGTEISLAGGLPEIMAPGASVTIDVELTSIGETVNAGSETFYYRYDGGAYNAVPLTDLGDGMYRAALPPAGCDDVPEFYFAATGSVAGVTYLPESAPSEAFSLPVGEITTYFADDFEADTGWTVSNSVGLGDGAWDRGTPAGGGERGDPAADYDGSGQCYLTDNVYGNSDVDDGTTSLISPVIDLSGGDAGIQFAVWYTNNFGADPNNDVFEVYVSNNGGGSWTLVETIGPQTPAGGWNLHSFTVGDFVTPTAQVKVRFDASDLGSGSVVEAGVDAFRVFQTTCEDIECPGDLDGDLDIDLSDLAQLLSNYGTETGAAYADGDLDGDGDVDLSDLAALLSVYGTGC